MKKKFISMLLIVCMVFMTAFTGYANGSTMNYKNTILSKDYVKIAQNSYDEMTPMAKEVFLNAIKSEPELLAFHINNVDSSYKQRWSLVEVNEIKSDVNVVRSSLYVRSALANPIDEIKIGLQLLNLPTAVYYSLLAFGSSLVAAVADGPLPVGDIVALGAGLVSGIVIGWYWNDIKDKVDGIADVFVNALSQYGSSIRRAVMKLFNMAESETEEAYEEDKENGTETEDHEVLNGNSLPRDGQTPNSSKDLKDSNGTTKQRRYYDENGDADMDIDYKHGGVGHTFPHRHYWNDGFRGPEVPF